MSEKSLSLFHKAWYHNRTYSAVELVEEVGKLAHMPEITRWDRGHSSNRLILSKSSELVFPDFLQQTIGGNNPECSLYTVFQVASDYQGSIESFLRIMQLIAQNKQIDLLSNISIEKSEFEFLFSGIPIKITFNPMGVDFSDGVIGEPSCIQVEPFGAMSDSINTTIADSFGFYLSDPDGVGFMARSAMIKFLDLFKKLDLEAYRSESIYVISSGLKNNSEHEAIRYLIELLSTGDCLFLQSRVKYILPPQLRQSELNKFCDIFQKEMDCMTNSGGNTQLSFFLNFGSIDGFIFNDEYLSDESHEKGALTGMSLKNYRIAHSRYLEEFVEWIAATANLKTVSGVIPA